jgi:hypothetical protein
MKEFLLAWHEVPIFLLAKSLNAPFKTVYI